MRQQIGNGILDSIGGFFKGAATKVGNWFSGANKQPKPVELSTFNKAQTTKHKAEAFFDDQKQKEISQIQIEMLASLHHQQHKGSSKQHKDLYQWQNHGLIFLNGNHNHLHLP